MLLHPFLKPKLKRQRRASLKNNPHKLLSTFMNGFYFLTPRNYSLKSKVQTVKPSTGYILLFTLNILTNIRNFKEKRRVAVLDHLWTFEAHDCISHFVVWEKRIGDICLHFQFRFLLMAYKMYLKAKEFFYFNNFIENIRSVIGAFCHNELFFEKEKLDWNTNMISRVL